MVLEVAPLRARAGQERAFETAFLDAQRIIAAMPGYLSHELHRCLEPRREYMLLVRFPIVSHYEAVDGARSTGRAT